MDQSWQFLFKKHRYFLLSVGQKLDQLVDNRKVIYPNKQDLFRAFQLTPFRDIKVVILGQDPYHKPKQANGLAFSVNPTIKVPPSLKNIYKELERDLKIKPPNHGDLTKWAHRGVFLLNRSLTVEEKNPGSHIDIWQDFTNDVVYQISQKPEPVVFMLWGKKAQSVDIEKNNNLILTTSHPSPYSVNKGFNGCGHFSKANTFLETPVNWEL